MSQYEEDWFGPKTGLLAGGVPLPPRRPPDLGQPRDGADLPMSPQMRDDLRNLIERTQRSQPVAPGYAEGEIIRTPGTTTVPHINRLINDPPMTGPEDINDPRYAKQPLPREFEPARPIPLGEIQRRWGVPRLEDL